MRFNLFNLLPFWQAIRRHSLTAAIVFSSTILGVSVVRLLRRILHELSVPWLFLWIVPILVIGAVAQREKQWVPNPDLRRKLALGIALGSIALALLIGKIRRELAPPPDPATEESQPADTSPTRDHRPGPRGK